MKKNNLNNFYKGWICGIFDRAIIKSPDFEVGFKYFKDGDSEPLHYHTSSTEITVVLKGKVKMNGEIFSEGEIIILEPNELSLFEVIEDSITCAIRDKSIVGGDKVEC